MTKTKEKRVLRKFFISCPKCDNSKPLEVIDRAGKQQDIEICLCGFPENQGFIRVERKD